jgi:hypothetical protein
MRARGIKRLITSGNLGTPAKVPFSNHCPKASLMGIFLSPGDLLPAVVFTNAVVGMLMSNLQKLNKSVGARRGKSPQPSHNCVGILRYREGSAEQIFCFSLLNKLPSSREYTILRRIRWP